jgi:hypothetical protein
MKHGWKKRKIEQKVAKNAKKGREKEQRRA